jgi:hypothetical protein
MVKAISQSRFRSWSDAAVQMTTELSHRPIIIESDDITAEGLLHTQILDEQQRMMRAAKIWAIMWLLMLFSLPLFIIHFVLVPGFLIAGPVMAARRYGVSELPDHISGNCPLCKQEFTLGAASFDRLPIRAPCPACGKILLLSEKAQ